MNLISIKRTGLDLGLGLTIGVFAALVSLMVSLLIDPLLAPLVPVAMIFGLFALSQPVAAALTLIAISYMDALAKTVFFFSPLSPFKLFTGVLVVALLLQVTRFRDHIKEVKRTTVFRGYFAFMLAWFIALVMADSIRQGLSWAIDLATVAVLLPMLLFTLKQENYVRYGILILAGGSAVSSIILVADIVLGTQLVSTTEAATTARTAEGFDRSSGGSNENPTTAATMLLTGTIIAVVHTIESPYYRRVLGAAAVIGTIGVLMSFARSALLVYVIVGLILAVRYRTYRLFPLFCVFALIGFFSLLPFLPASFWDRVLSIFGGGGDWTLGRRLSYNIIGIKLLFENPVFGVGPGNFFSLFTNEEFRFLPGRTLTGRQLHNMYLSVAVEYGMVGFSCFMAIIIGGFRACRKTMAEAASAQTRAAATALYYGMIAYFIVSVFVPNEYNKYTWLLPALAATLYVTSKKADREDSR